MSDYEDPKDLFRDAFGSQFGGDGTETFHYQLPEEELTGTRVPLDAAVERYEEELTDTDHTPEERLAAARDAAAEDGDTFFANVYEDARKQLR